MRNAIESIPLIAAFATLSIAATPGVAPVPSSRNDRALTAIADWGHTFLAGRELRVDLQLPGGKSGKGEIFILFEPSSGLLLFDYAWFNFDYPKEPWLDLIASRALVGVAANRISVILPSQHGLTIQESSEKAMNLDDAEAKAVIWMSDHLVEVGARSLHGAHLVQVGLDRSRLPADFFSRPEGEPDAREVFFPLKLVDMVWRGRGWDITVESTETKRMSNLILLEPNRTSGMNVRAVEYTHPESKKRE